MITKRKTINIKFALWLLIGLILFCTGAHFLHAFQVKRNAGIFLEQADYWEKKKESRKALDYLKRYISLVPEDTDGMARYGLLLANMGEEAKSVKTMDTAYRVLDQVLRRDETRHEVRRRQIRSAMHPGLKNYAAAKIHLDRLIEFFGKSGEFLNLQAQCLEWLGDPKQARQLYQEALGYPDQKKESYIRLAYLLQQQKDKAALPIQIPGKKEVLETNKQVLDLANEMVTALAKEYSEDYETHLALANYYRYFPDLLDRKKNIQKIAEHIDKARALAPDEKEVILSYGELELDRSKNAKENSAQHLALAREEMNRGIGLFPAEYRMYYGLARVEAASKNFDQAVLALEKGLVKLPGHLDLQWRLADLLIGQGKFAEAEKALKVLTNLGLPDPELNYLRGRIHFGKEEWLSAIQLIDLALPHLQSRAEKERDWLAIDLVLQCNFLLASCYENLGDMDAVVTAYNRINFRHPNLVPCLLGLARAEAALGRKSQAVLKYKYLMKLGNAPAIAWIECAQAILEQNRKPDPADFAAADAILKQAEKIPEINGAARLLRAELLVAQEGYDKARLFLEKNTEDAKNRPIEVWIGLASFEQRQGRFAQALAYLDDAEQRYGDIMEIRLARARYWIAREPSPQTTPALENLGQNLGKFSLREQRQIRGFLAAGYLNSGLPIRAKDIWRELIARNPKSEIGSRLALFDQLVREKDAESLTKIIDDLRAIEGPKGSLWRYCQAVQYATQAQKSQEPAKLLTQAGDLLKEVASLRPNWTRARTAEAQIQDLKGNFPQAIRLYYAALKLGEQNPLIIQRLIDLLQNSGRIDELRELADSLRRQNLDFAGQSRLETAFAIRDNNWNLAVKLAETEANEAEKDYTKQVWLGNVCWMAGKTAEAEKAYRKGVALAPDVPDAWVSLVAFLGGTKQTTQAMAAMADAEKAIAKELLPLTLARCHESLGKFDRAKEYYEQTLAAKPNDSFALSGLALNALRRKSMDEALVVLKKISQLKGEPDSRVADARRLLTILTAQGGDFAKTVEALNSLGFIHEGRDNIPLMPAESLADQRAKIAILTASANPTQRRKAIPLLEDLLVNRQANNDDLFTLANLYESVGEWKKAEAQFLKLLSLTQANQDAVSQKKQGDLLALIVNGLIKHDAASRAEPWLGQLETLEPKTFRTVALRSLLLNKKKRGPEAVAGLLALAKSDDKYLRPVAVILEQINQEKPAEELLTKYVAGTKKPESVLILAEFLGRRNRIGEALDLCEKARKNCKIEQVAASAVAVLYSGKSTDEECRRVAAWLQAAISGDEKETALMTQLAAIRRLQKDYTAALDLYRKVYRQTDKDPLLLNNYAWLLALSEKNGTEALKVINRAIELDGPLAELLDTRSVVYQTIGQPKQAIEDLNEIITGEPNPHRLFHLAQAHHQDGNRVAAAEAFQSAQRLGLNLATIDPLETSSYQSLLALYGSNENNP